MNAEGFALNQIIIMAQSEMRRAIAQLQVEDKGREVAKLQGRVAGYKDLIGNIAARFSLTQGMLDDEGDEPVKIPDMKDEELDIVNYDAKVLLDRPEWKQVIDRVESNVYAWKESLFELCEELKTTRKLALVAVDTIHGMTKGEGDGETWHKIVCRRMGWDL